MLETRFKIALLVVVALFASFPIMGILRGTSLTPFETQDSGPSSAVDSEHGDGVPVQEEPPLADAMALIPAGDFLRGYDHGGFDEAPQSAVYLDSYHIDRYEVTNYHYQEFVAATGHRKAGPPSRYAKNMARMHGPNQPVVYVSYDDAETYCRWKGKRLPTEAEWEKAMRGTAGRLWPWGNDDRPGFANWARISDGYEVAATVGRFAEDRSPYGVMDGAGNVMEWVRDWYSETAYREFPGPNPVGPEAGTYRVLRGGGYTTTGGDFRLSSRNKIVPDFRDETIGFRCAKSDENVTGTEVSDEGKSIRNQSSRGLETRPK
ncbi:hypothetical protein YTPLAS18_26470 [Nitrospira sp.]|nr:hypothetical protein YTPLAS18_26470 [Nitrospira sp.]